MNKHRILGLAAVVALTAACGGKSGPGAETPATGPLNKAGETVEKAAKDKFDAAIAQLMAHDQKSDWTQATCTQVAGQFAEAVEEQSKGGKRLPEANYNAGLAYQRCQMGAEAKAQFQAAVSADPGFHRAKVQLALYEYHDKGDAVLDQTIQKLHDAVLEAKFQNVDALVNLAMLQARRGGPAAGQGCKSDQDCAKLNIQRALAIDDGYMPAFNQLALYYLNEARTKAQDGKAVDKRKRRSLTVAGGEQKALSGQMLDLAALVCSQAIRKNQKYAPIYNTLGLIQVEQRNINNAVQAFNTARRLDPSFFEAQMNYAAVNLGFRGFDQAEEAYRQALKMRPTSYEAHLGLALAMRGQIDDTNWDKFMNGAEGELAQCKQIAPDRVETYFNEGILVQEFKAKSATSDEAKIGVYEQAIRIFDTFIQKAGSSSDYAEAVKNAQDRKKDMVDIIKFIREGIEAEKQAKAAPPAPPAQPAPAPAAGEGGDQ